MLENITTKLPLKFPRSSLPERYNRAAQKWHVTMENLGYVRAYGEMVVAAKPIHQQPTNSNPLNVLDVGCGTGAFATALCQHLNHPLHLHLLDISPKMLAKAQQNLQTKAHEVTLVCADFGDLKTTAQKFHIILCAHVIDHLKDPFSALQILKNRLMPGGVLLLIISQPHWCTSLLQLRWRHNAYRPKTICELLKNSGYEQIQTFPFSEGPPKFTSHGYIVRNRPKQNEESLK